MTRSHSENQERAYVAASRRTDRSLDARFQSAQMASQIHQQRTGRGFQITLDMIVNEEMYQEIDDHARPNASGAQQPRLSASESQSQYQDADIHKLFANAFPNGIPNGLPNVHPQMEQIPQFQPEDYTMQQPVIYAQDGTDGWEQQAQQPSFYPPTDLDYFNMPPEVHSPNPELSAGCETVVSTASDWSIDQRGAPEREVQFVHQGEYFPDHFDAHDSHGMSKPGAVVSEIDWNDFLVMDK